MTSPETVRNLSENTPTPEPEEQVPGWAGARMSRCDTCGTEDNHPMTLVIRQFGDPARGIPDVVEEHHHDCLALSLGDAHAAEVVTQSGGLKGHALRVFLHGDPERGIAPAFDPTTVQEA